MKSCSCRTLHGEDGKLKDRLKLAARTLMDSLPKVRGICIIQQSAEQVAMVPLRMGVAIRTSPVNTVERVVVREVTDKILTAEQRYHHLLSP